MRIKLLLVIAFQQCIYAFIQTFRFNLIGNVPWVVFGPLTLLCIANWLTPLLMRTECRNYQYIRLVAKRGWLFVALSLLWVCIYWMLSIVFGVPIYPDSNGLS